MISDQYSFNHFEPHFSQTLNEQQSLFESLVKEAHRKKDDEAILLTQLAKNNLLDQQPLTIISSLTEHQCNRILGNSISAKNFFNPLQSTNALSLLKLDQALNHTTNLLILNPYIAAIMFLYPDSLKPLALKIKGQLIFPHYIKKHPFQIEWGRSFRATECSNQHYWRWALQKESHIYVINNSPNTRQLSFQATVQHLDERTDITFHIYFRNVFLIQQTTNNHLTFCVDVPPGRHRLSIIDKQGTGVKGEGWAQTLYYSLNDLTVIDANENIELNKEHVYTDTPFLSPLDDKIIRDALHANHFFEVNACAFSNKSFSHQLATTRFDYLDKHYQYKEESNSIHESNAVNTWYFAKRTATLR